MSSQVTMRGSKYFRIAAGLAPLLLMACGSDAVTPASTSTPTSAVPQMSPATAAAGSTASLTNTYWKLMTLQGSAAASPPGTREIHLILQLNEQRVAGFSGCNRLMGGYQLAEDRLSFSQIAGTMMACPQPAMDTERDFHVMLQKVVRWRIDGERLDLLDASGATLAQFESRYMQ